MKKILALFLLAAAQTFGFDASCYVKPPGGEPFEKAYVDPCQRCPNPYPAEMCFGPQLYMRRVCFDQYVYEKVPIMVKKLCKKYVKRSFFMTDRCGKVVRCKTYWMPAYCTKYEWKNTYRKRKVKQVGWVTDFRYCWEKPVNEEDINSLTDFPYESFFVEEIEFPCEPCGSSNSACESGACR